jgi:RNA polymerase sigma-70 factor (ECF subfamily)
MVPMSVVPRADPTDADLIAEAVRDPAAFATVFDRHYADIHGFLRARVGEGLADELASETFLQALRAAGRYDNAYPDARPWLYGIASNLVGRQRRAEARRLRAYRRVEIPQPASDHAGDALAPALVAALEALPEADRDALLLVAWGELSYEEAARAEDVPIGTLRSRIHRARRRLRAALGENIDDGVTS